MTLLDVTRFGEDAAAVDRHVREQVGAYRLFTPQPVGIRIDEDAFANGGAERVRPARERAASLGCDLLLLMHPDRVTYGYSNPARSNQAGSYEVPVLVVLMGRLEE
ncbi:MAG: hypothetical protein P8Y54_00445 [Xanthomonadales bacterium]